MREVCECVLICVRCIKIHKKKRTFQEKKRSRLKKGKILFIQHYDIYDIISYHIIYQFFSPQGVFVTFIYKGGVTIFYTPFI